MFTKHLEDSLARYCDDELSAAGRQRVDAHLATCSRCRAVLEEIRFSASLVRQLEMVSAPPSVWNRIEGSLSASSGASAYRLRWAYAFGAMLVAGAVLVAVYWSTREATPRPWEVAQLSNGSPRRMAVGEWVETSGSRARIIVGQLGTVDVAPDTRVRLGRVNQSEYRLALARGTISAEINAPPRLFIVDTPASAVVDLGCAYTASVGEDGAGELRMTKGWASLEWNGRESLVPAGARCRTKPGRGPGTPYFDDASAALKQAVNDFDGDKDRSRTLDVIFDQARVRDTLTLWHLLSRVDAPDRVRVFERIAQFEPPPAPISRQQILALEPDALRQWREELAWKW
jgi:predicted anti-sigma-YlaC factor YlaD